MRSKVLAVLIILVIGLILWKTVTAIAVFQGHSECISGKLYWIEPGKLPVPMGEQCP